MPVAGICLTLGRSSGPTTPSSITSTSLCKARWDSRTLAEGRKYPASVIFFSELNSYRSLILEVYYQELEVSFSKNEELPMLVLSHCGQLPI
jgi:hypothetical protein